MAFFGIGRKFEVAKEYSLQEIPIFSGLSPAEQRLIEKKARLMEVKRGDLVYQEGTPSEAFYVVISGRFRVFTKSRNRQEGETLLSLYRGDHFGEVSLLTGKHHSASVEAKTDGIILKLDKEDFLRLVKEIPSISLYLNRALGHRLTRREDVAQGRSRIVKIAAFFAQANIDVVFQFWLDLCASVHRVTSRKVILIDFVASAYPLFAEEFKKESCRSLDLSKMDMPRESDIKDFIQPHPSGFFYLRVPVDKVGEKDEKKISSLITLLTYRYDYLMIRLSQDLNPVMYQTLKQSDMVYLYCSGSAENLIGCSQKVEDFNRSFGFTKNEIKVLIPDKAGDKDFGFEEKEKMLGHRIFSLIPNKSEQPERYDSALNYISRELAEKLVGLALGSGAAYGLAHIGVLRVLEQENIPVDVITGSSIGALLGALWAAGYKADDLENVTKSLNKQSAFLKILGFQDMSVAHRGFFKGNQVAKFLEGYLGNKTFHDLKIPVKIIAANLFTSEEVILESGRVVDAIRASISIPGIFRPYKYRGDYLIDGGIIDPLPVRVLSQMGVKKIIAVNVLLGPKDRSEQNRYREKNRHEKLKRMAEKSLMSRFYGQFLYKLRERYADNIFNVIMSTIQFMEFEMAQASSAEADIFIHPQVYEAHWAQFYNPEKFIQAGEEKTREQLTEIKQLIAE